jgi:nucleoside-diphosphate-sugar epimerase
MKAFVAGATGYTGREVVRELARRGIDVVAHVRPDSTRLASWQQHFTAEKTVIDTTPWSLTALENTFATHNPTHIFALLGTTRARARAAAREGREESYETVDYGLTHTLIDAARTCAPAARFVYLSSLGVGDSAKTEYLRVRARLERELKDSGLRFIIARPAFITGTDREEFRLGERVGARVFDFALKTVSAIGLKSVRARFASMSGKQLARALVNAALDPDCLDNTIEVARLHKLAGF